MVSRLSDGLEGVALSLVLLLCYLFRQPTETPLYDGVGVRT